MSLVKKIVSSFVSFTMVASTVGTGLLALPGAASAATLVSGDLIKASGPAVYYYGSDMKRYVFPNETTFFSWFMDFSSVKVITDAELAAVQIGGNMTMRPGTKLVKITTDPKVYAVTKCGTLHWVESESVAISLFGSNWARRVVDVPDAFFVNYSVGSSIPSAVHPNGSLISYASEPGMTYVVWNGMKRKLVGAGMSANMYNPANVIATTIAYPAGADVTARESDLSDAVCMAVTLPPSGMVTVSLASDTPAGATLPKGSSGSMLAKFNLMGGSSAVTVSGLRVHRVGVGSTSDFSNVYLYDANGTRLTTGRTINSTTNTVEFNGLNVMVAAGQTVPLVIVGDVQNSGSSMVTGGQHAFEIMDAASVIMPTTTGMTITGSFPVRANTFVIGTAAAARLDVQKGSTPADVNVGSTQIEISNFKLIANTNDIEIRRVTLFQGGDISNSDLRNFNLYQGTTVVATAAAITGNGQIVLNFNPPYLIPNGNTRVFSLKADVTGRSGRAIKTYVEYSTDIYAVDKTYGSGALVCISTSSPTSCSSSGATFDGTSTNFITLNTRGGQFTIAFNGPPTQNVAKGQNGVVLYRFALTSQSSQVEVRNMYVKVGSTNGGQVCNGTSATACDEDFIKNVRIRDVATGQTVQGPTSPSSATIIGTGATSTITFSNSIYLNIGQTRNFEVVVDLSSSSDTDYVDKNFVVQLNTFNTNDIRVVDTGEYLTPSASVVPNANITGNVMTVKASSLTVGLASSPSSATVVKKQALVPSLGMSFQAGAQSDVLVTAVKVTGQASFTSSIGAATAANLATSLSSCALYEGDTIRSDGKTPDSSGVMNFTNLSWRVGRGLNKTLVVKCTMASVLGGSAGVNTFSLGLINGATDVTAQDQDSNTVTATVSTAVDSNGDNTTNPAVRLTVQNSGTVTINSENSSLQSTILVPSPSAWYPVAKFSASAQNEDVRIERLIVTTTGDSSAFTAIGVAKDGTLLAESPLQGGMNSSQDIDLGSTPLMVMKDSPVSFQIWAKLTNLQASSQTTAGAPAPRSGNAFTVGLAAGNTTGEYDSNYTSKFNVKMVGMGSGERIYAAGSSTLGNTFVVRKSKPMVTIPSSSAVLTNSSEYSLMTFTVGADAAGPVSLKKFTLSFSKSTGTASALALSSFKLKRAGEFLDTSLYTIQDTNGGNLVSGTWPVASTTGRIVVTFTSPELIAGQGVEYSVRANVAGTAAGDSVSVGFTTTGVTTVVTGYLTADSANTILSSMGLPGPNLNATTSGNAIVSFPGTFVWSDRSETTPGSATSGDWMDDLYVRRFDTLSYTR